MQLLAPSDHELAIAEPTVHADWDPLTIDAVEFRQKFGQEPFTIQHDLADHPLFELPRLLELARRLPADLIEYNAGELPVNQDPELTPRNGLSVEETLRRIQECKSWMVLKHVHTDPAYGDLLNRCLNQVRPLSEPIVPGMCHALAYVFITSPGSVTPYHMDPEHNFLLQVRGSKTVHMFDGRNRQLCSEIELERFYGAQSRHMQLAEENRDKDWVCPLAAGEGLHFPVTYPHWVQNGPEVSISFSITFRTPDLDRRTTVYRVNHGLRQRGWNPLPYGQSPLRDGLIYHGYRIARKVGRLLGRSW